MTDKQIVIDGVDVSGCKKYEHEIIRCNATLKNMCFCGGRCTDKKNADCYYKQLKRKEQECEELKRELQAQRDFTAHEQKLIYCVAYDETCKTGNDCKREKCIFKDNIKLKQTITEIKEITETCSFTDSIELLLNRIKQILQKISECEVENQYNTKDIRHINESNQEYIAEGNRMTKK